MSLVFLIMFSLGASGVGIHDDINEYFYDYLSKYVITPYFGLYKFQLLVIALLIIGSVSENKKYLENNEPGLVLFLEKQKLYSIAFLTGIYFNLLPIFLLFISFILVTFKLL
ncbi:MAG: hypothetical protein K2F57_05675 [Candidatus Gastranaerophilales bacterium]|nr:hypothetical protein [Candidatus Gastranaerophilales bacterium]